MNRASILEKQKQGKIPTTKKYMYIETAYESTMRGRLYEMKTVLNSDCSRPSETEEILAQWIIKRSIAADIAAF